MNSNCLASNHEWHLLEYTKLLLSSPETSAVRWPVQIDGMSLSACEVPSTSSAPAARVSRRFLEKGRPHDMPGGRLTREVLRSPATPKDDVYEESLAGTSVHY
jgi:hypothetical protein